VEVCGEPATKSERAAYNRALKELREANATPEEVRRRAGAYRSRWPRVSLTPSALAKHWGALGRPERPPGQAVAAVGGLPPAMAVQQALYEREVAGVAAQSAVPLLPPGDRLEAAG
jgi:hypothetical protein